MSCPISSRVLDGQERWFTLAAARALAAVSFDNLGTQIDAYTSCHLAILRRVGEVSCPVTYFHMR